MRAQSNRWFSHAVVMKLSRSLFFVLIIIRGLHVSSAITQEPAGQEYCTATATIDDPSEWKQLSPIYTSLPQGSQKFRVRSVYDGDTLTLTNDRRVRFLGIDTPEIKPLQPFAEDAKEYTKSRCDQKDVWLLMHGTDRYDRILAHIFVEESNGKYLCVNEGLVQEGFANTYTPRMSQKPFDWDKLLKLQIEAREMKRGIWRSFQDVLVYKSAHGSAYHKRSCSHISNSRNLQQLKASEAADLGLHPCRSCMSLHT